MNDREIRSVSFPSVKRTARVALMCVLCWFCGPGLSGPARGAAVGLAAAPVRSDGTLVFTRSDGTVCASIAIEIAETPEARATGLMGRTLPDDTVGMLFVYRRSGDRSFWMRNTPTPLDIIFVSENRKIVNIARNTEPMSDSRYSSDGPVMYVIEVIAGFCKRHGVGKGTQVRWHRH